MVACTPDSYIATHMTAPTAKYAGPRQTCRRERPMKASTHRPAMARATKSISSE
jgi:hypothetical protein